MLSVAKRLLYGQRIREKSTELPYDAEVEWLEATGTQWIDTGLANAANRLIRVRFQKTGSVSADLVLPFHTYISRSVFVGVRIQNPGIGWVFRGACITGMQTLGPADLDWHEAEIDTTVNQKSLWFDGVKKYEVAAGVSTTLTITNKLFAYTSSSTADPTNFGSGRIAAYTVTDTATGQVIQDLIPVRKNGIGYMYDRVSGNLLGSSGTGAFLYGPDKPYDYEVEYIERDFTKPWMVEGVSDWGGFDLSEYCDSYAPATMTKRLDCTFCFSPFRTGIGVAASISQQASGGAGGFGVCMAMGKYNNSTFYAGWYGSGLTPKVSSTESSLGNFHTMSIVPNGDTTASIQLDGTEVSGSTTSSTVVMSYFKVLVTNSKTVTSGRCQMRVKNVRLGSDVYLIPVVKGNALGFYNMVDGHLFLEEQACLSAGPRA